MRLMKRPGHDDIDKEARMVLVTLMTLMTLMRLMTMTTLMTSLSSDSSDAARGPTGRNLEAAWLCCLPPSVIVLMLSQIVT